MMCWVGGVERPKEYGVVRYAGEVRREEKGGTEGEEKERRQANQVEAELVGMVRGGGERRYLRSLEYMLVRRWLRIGCRL